MEEAACLQLYRVLKDHDWPYAVTLSRVSNLLLIHCPCKTVNCLLEMFLKSGEYLCPNLHNILTGISLIVSTCVYSWGRRHSLRELFVGVWHESGQAHSH